MSTDLTRIFYITFWILNKSYFDWPLTKIVCSIDSGLFFWNWFVSILSFFRFSEVINQKCIQRRSNHYLSVWPKKQTDRRKDEAKERKKKNKNKVFKREKPKTKYKNKNGRKRRKEEKKKRKKEGWNSCV